VTWKEKSHSSRAAIAALTQRQRSSSFITAMELSVDGRFAQVVYPASSYKTLPQWHGWHAVRRSKAHSGWRRHLNYLDKYSHSL
jgi:hypothetical protein